MGYSNLFHGSEFGYPGYEGRNVKVALRFLDD
jgi:hypothetical protein